jgi:hypothetical protein
MERPSWIDVRPCPWILATLVGLALTTSAAPSRAQATDAEALTTQGIALRRDHKNAEALETFRRAFALAPGPRIQAHLGLAEQSVGQWLEAERDIRAALEAREDPWIVKNRDALEQAVRIVVGHLGWIDVQTAVPDAEIWLNGSQVTRRAPGEPIRVVAGTNVVEVRAPGYLPTMRTLLVLPNTRMTESFALSPLPAPPDREKAAIEARGPEAPSTVGPSTSTPGAARTPDAEPAKGLSPVVYVGLAVGGAGVLVGSVTGLLSLSRASKAKEGCHPDRSCDASSQPDIDASRTLADVANVSFVIGGVGAAVGVVAWLLHPSRKTTVTARPNGMASEVTPVLGDRWLGVAGRF